jgi:arylsulfatase A-like enzyme
VLAILATACGDQTRAPKAHPDVVLITLDTTRADHMSAYGYPRETTPHLDPLAEDAVRFDAAYAVTSWTLPSHASIFTGKFPSAHGAQYDPSGPLSLTQEGGIKGPGPGAGFARDH